MKNLYAIEKNLIFEETKNILLEKGFHIVSQDRHRPWGGFFVIDEAQAELFINTYFSQFSLADFQGFAKLSPKILLVAPEQRLSWQYHHRRAEIWKLVGGSAKIMLSDTDEPQSEQAFLIGETRSISQGQRHRLIGDKEKWGIVAEIWKHTQPDNPSDELDIVRVQDDFGR